MGRYGEKQVAAPASLLKILIQVAATVLATACSTAVLPIQAQSTVGLQPFGSYQGGFDKINLADLGLHVDIPLYQHKARGASNGVSVHLIYDGSYWSPNNGDADFGWRVAASAAAGSGAIEADEQNFDCPNPAQGQYQSWTYSFTDGTGYRHPFPGSSTFNINNCDNVTTTVLGRVNTISI